MDRWTNLKQQLNGIKTHKQIDIAVVLRMMEELENNSNWNLSKDGWKIYNSEKIDKDKHFYYISFIAKNSNTGNMKDFCIKECKPQELKDVIDNCINELKKHYQDVHVDTVTKL